MSTKSLKTKTVASEKPQRGTTRLRNSDTGQGRHRKRVTANASGLRTGNRMDTTTKYLNWTTEGEREEMFECYTQVRMTGGISEVARRFGRSRSTISRCARQGRWRERYEKIKTKSQNKLDKAIGTRESKNLKIVRDVKDAILKDLNEQLKAGTYEVTVGELISLIRLEVELTGELPGESGDNIVNIFNTIPVLADKQQREKVYGNLAQIFGAGNGSPGIKLPGNRFVASDN